MQSSTLLSLSLAMYKQPAGGVIEPILFIMLAAHQTQRKKGKFNVIKMFIVTLI